MDKVIRRRGLAALLVFVMLAVLCVPVASGSLAQASLEAVVAVRGGAAGHAGDENPTTFAFAADNAVTQLARSDGTPLALGDVAALYGTADGMTIYADGINITSPAYRGLAGPKTPLGLDLSDTAGWPNIAVPSGRVAIDPVRGRFKFHEGGEPCLLTSWNPNTFHSYAGIFIQGQYAYIADWAGQGLHIVDISDPANPVWKSSLTTLGHGVDVIVDGSYAYLTMKSGGLRIINVSDPVHPVEVGGIKASPTENDLALHHCKAGDLVFVADEKFGAVIYNVAIPSQPVKVGACPIGFAESVWVRGNLAYVAGGLNGMQIYDVSVPSRPQLRSWLPRLSYSYDVQVAGEYAYLAEGRGGLRVVNVADPTEPQDVVLLPTPGEAYDIQIANGCAYVAERVASTYGYVEVFSLHDPAAPELLSRYRSNKGVSGVFPHGPYVYAAGQDLGLLVVDANLPEAPLGAVTVDYNRVEGPLPGETTTLTLQVALQGRGSAPSTRWQVPLMVELTDAQGEALRHSYTVTCDTQGRATIEGIPRGTYDVRVRRSTTLVNVARACILNAATHSVNLGTLLEGDINQDGKINLLDFSILSSSYGGAQGSAQYDGRADFNGDNLVNILDFSLLASNYGVDGPQEVTSALLR